MKIEYDTLYIYLLFWVFTELVSILRQSMIATGPTHQMYTS